MADISTIDRAIEFVDSVEEAVENQGVNIPEGTVAENYDNYINEIAEKAVEENVPKAYEEGKQAEYDAFWDAYQQNGERTNYEGAFAGEGWTEDLCKPKYDMHPTRLYMFLYNATNLNDVDFVELFKKQGITFDTSQCTNFQYSLMRGTHWGVIDTTAANGLNTQVFFNANKLHTIDELIVKETTTYGAYTFQGCSALANLKIGGTIGKTLPMSACPLTVESAKSVINALKNYAGTDEALTYKLTLKGSVWTALNEAEVPPSGDTWQDYVSSLGWQCG